MRTRKVDEVLAGGNKVYDDYVKGGKCHEAGPKFVAPLSHYVSDYVELLRQKGEPRPRGVTFNIRFLIKHVEFNLETPHLYHIQLDQLPPQLRTHSNRLKWEFLGPSGTP